MSNPTNKDIKPRKSDLTTLVSDAVPLTRRSFIRRTTAGAAAVALTACGGGPLSFNASLIPSTTGSTPSPTPVPTTPTDTTPTTGSLSPQSAWFQLVSAVGGKDAPFTLGYGFKKGEVPSGANVVGSIPTLQVSVKNRWPDGSLKFAVISGHATLTAGTAQTITLSTGTPTGGRNLTTADLKATGVTASVGAGSFGTAAWSGVDWDTPTQTWISGPQMSSWIYRKPIGTDAHLVAWLEVRLYAGGSVEVLPYVENGYLNVAGPTNKNAVYNFTLGGSQRFSGAIDLAHHCRAVLASGSVLSHWLGADPRIIPKHNTAYLQDTKLVPAYHASVAPGSTLWSRLAQTYTPLGLANFPQDMGSAGYDSSIGILPEWDVAYLVGSADPRAYAAIIINSYSAGRYATHYRDETTQRPIRFSTYPKLVLNSSNSSISGVGQSTTNTVTPAPSGTAAPVWGSTHHPSLGFMAYLLTGRFYFMEEVQFVATLHYLKQNDGGPYANRQGSQGILMTHSGANTVRGAAWSTRTLAQAACITPDDDTALRSEFLASMEANVNYYHGTYVAKPNNPQGFVSPYNDYTEGDGKYLEATWQQDFFTAAYGYALDMGLALSDAGTSKMREFFAWKARSIIGRFGTTATNEYLYRDAAPYTIAVAPSDTPDFLGGTGPWYTDWGQIYLATTGQTNGAATGTDLRGGYFPDATGYWGNLQPALAYAVEHQVAGAQAAYNRMVNASNWSLMSASFNTTPVWSVKPRNI